MFGWYHKLGTIEGGCFNFLVIFVGLNVIAYTLGFVYKSYIDSHSPKKDTCDYFYLGEYIYKDFFGVWHSDSLCCEDIYDRYGDVVYYEKEVICTDSIDLVEFGKHNKICPFCMNPETIIR